MRRLISKLAIALLAIVVFEAGLLPRLLPFFKPDLFVGLLIGVSIYLPFNPGFAFVLGSSLVLQIFSGGRIGYLPFVYVFGFLALDVVKNLVFLENIFAQLFFGTLMYVGVVYSAEFFVDVGVFSGMPVAFTLSALFSGLCTPLMVWLVGRLWEEYEQS